MPARVASLAVSQVGGRPVLRPGHAAGVRRACAVGTHPCTPADAASRQRGPRGARRVQRRRRRRVAAAAGPHRPHRPHRRRPSRPLTCSAVAPNSSHRPSTATRHRSSIPTHPPTRHAVLHTLVRSVAPCRAVPGTFPRRDCGARPRAAARFFNAPERRTKKKGRMAAEWGGILLVPPAEPRQTAEWGGMCSFIRQKCGRTVWNGRLGWNGGRPRYSTRAESGGVG